METKKLICIVCPKGCSIDVTLDDGKIVGVTGNTCKRGEKYAREEITSPRRTVTSTVFHKDGTLIPVKTADTIPKALVFEAMRLISLCHPDGDVRIGDVVANTASVLGADIVACADHIL